MTSAKIRRRVGRRDSGVGRATGQLSPAQTDSRLVMSVALTAATAPAFPFRAPTQQPQSCLACAALVTGPGSVRLCPSLIWLFSATRVSSPSEHVISSSYRTPLPGYIYTNTQERSGNQPGTIVRSLYNKTRSLLLHWSCGGGHDGQRRLQARWGERRRRVRRMTKAIDGNGKMLRDDGRLCAFDPQAISGGDGECAMLQIGNSKANKKSSKSGRCSNHCQ